jgi:endonuclease III
MYSSTVFGAFAPALEPRFRLVAFFIIDFNLLDDRLLACATHGTILPSVPQRQLLVPALLDRLEKVYGPQEPCFPTHPYEFLVWWHCGYPASDEACANGWDALIRNIGIDPDQLLRATPGKLAAALKAGGMVPELRAERLKEIARRVQDEFGGDLRVALVGPIAKVRKTLKSFSGIGDPGADRILLFAGISPISAVPSNCVHVLIRIRKGRESENYNANYRDAQRLLSAEVSEKIDALGRAFLLLKEHGQQICKRTHPKCDQCAVKSSCVYFAQCRQST